MTLQIFVFVLFCFVLFFRQNKKPNYKYAFRLNNCFTSLHIIRPCRIASQEAGHGDTRSPPGENPDAIFQTILHNLKEEEEEEEEEEEFI